MSKDRNTMAKRQREVEKRRKNEEKRERRIRRKADAKASSESPPASNLTDGEINVLAVFRKYLMSPGQMLCLSNADIDSRKLVLEKLTEAGLIVQEDFKGGYSLTRSGYDAMMEVC